MTQPVSNESTQKSSFVFLSHRAVRCGVVWAVALICDVDEPVVPSYWTQNIACRDGVGRGNPQDKYLREHLGLRN